MRTFRATQGRNMFWAVPVSLFKAKPQNPFHCLIIMNIKSNFDFFKFKTKGNIMSGVYFALIQFL